MTAGLIGICGGIAIVVVLVLVDEWLWRHPPKNRSRRPRAPEEGSK